MVKNCVGFWWFFVFSSTWRGWISTTIWSYTESNSILYKYSSIAVNCAVFRGTNILFGFRSRSMKIQNVGEITFASLLEVLAGLKGAKIWNFQLCKKNVHARSEQLEGLRLYPCNMCYLWAKSATIFFCFPRNLFFHIFSTQFWSVLGGKIIKMRTFCIVFQANLPLLKSLANKMLLKKWEILDFVQNKKSCTRFLY